MDPNTLNEELNQGTQALSREDIKSQLIQKYLTKKLESKESIKFLNDLDAEKEVPESMKKNLKLYLNISPFNQLSETDIDNLAYLDIIPEVTSKITGLRTRRTALKNLFLREYDITSSLYDRKLAPIIHNLDYEGLDNFLDLGEEERKELLVQVFGKKVPEKKNLLKFINDFNLKSRLKKLTPEQRERFEYTTSLIQAKNGQLEVHDLEELFDVGIFTESEKKELVSIFVPTMSLVTARHFGIVSEKEEEKIRYQYIDEGIDHFNLKKGLSKIELEELRMKMFSDLQSEDLLVETRNLSNFDSVIGNLIDAGGLERIIAGYNDVLHKANNPSGQLETYEQFEQALIKAQGKLKAQKFVPGSTLILSEQDANGNKHTFFFEIFNNGQNTGNVVLKPRGHNSYDKYDSGKLGARSFTEIIGIATNSLKDKTGRDILDFQVLDSFDLKTQIDSGKVPLETDSVKFIDDYDVLEEKKKVSEELDERKEELEKKGKTDHQIENDERVKDLHAKQEQLFNDSETVELKNERTFFQAIDELDPEGKNFGFHENLSFKSKRGSVYTVKHINPSANTVMIWSPASPTGMQEMSYTDFIHAFKSEGAKRISQSKTLEDLFQDVSSNEDLSKEWSKFHIEKGEIRMKEAKKKVDFDFLVGDDNELIKIVDINEGNGIATINFGKAKQEKKFEKDKNGKDLLDKSHIEESFQVDSTNYQVTVGWLEDYIKSHKQVPRGLEEGKAKETNFTEDHDDIKPHLLSRIFKNNYSVFEIVAGAKLTLENVQAFLKEGSDEHAAQFAKSVFGKILPDEITADLSSRLEASQKERSDAYINKLKSIDSGPATQMIKGWLKNGDVPQYKLEAGLLFMMEKYGTLYCKQLFPDDGKYLWYRALGGTVGDELFMEQYEDSEKSDVTFSEEQLVFAILGKQIRPPGYKGILRRSRMQKDYKAVRIAGKKDEIEKGKDDALRFRQIEDRIDGAMGELDGGNYPNAVGWIEEIINKGGSYEQMNKIPFIMAFSGIMYSFDDAYILDQIKNFNAKSMPVAMTRFMSKKSEMNLLNDTIMEICKRIEDVGMHKGIYQRALAIKGKWHGNTKDTKKDVILETAAFYEDYGEVLTNVLYQVNNGDSGENGFLNKMIMLEKDAGIGIDGKHQEGNTLFKEFYNHNKALTDADAEFDNETLMSDSFAGVGVTGVNTRKVLQQNIGFRTGGVPAKPKVLPVMWQEITKQIQTTTRTSFGGADLNSENNKQAQRKIIKDILLNAIAAMLDNHGQDPRILSSYEQGVFSIMSDWGIYASKDFLIDGKSIDPDVVVASSHKEFDRRVDTWVNNIINYEQGGGTVEVTSSQKGEAVKKQSSLDLIQEGVKDLTDEHLNKGAANDTFVDYEEAA